MASCGVKELLNKIDNEEYSIPSFQREFVWNTDKVLELLKSLFHGYPIGSLLLCPVNEGTIKFYKPKTFNYKLNKYVPDSYIVLDGQQRLTALHRAFSENYKTVPDSDEDKKRVYYIKIKVNESDSPTFEKKDMHIEIHSKKGKISRLEEDNYYLFPLYLLHNHDHELSEWRKIFSKSYSRKFKKNYPEVLNRAGEIFANDSTSNSIFCRLNNHELIPYLKLTGRASSDIERVCDMFDKLNMQGVNLSEFDILASRMYPKGIDLRKIWYELIKGKLIKKFKISPIDIMRTMSLIYQLDEIDKDGPTVDIRRIRRYMESFDDEKKFKSKFQQACISYEESLNHLRMNHGLIGKKWIPHNPLLVTFSAAWYIINLKERRERNKLLSKLECWYWCNVFNKRFEGSTITPIAEEFNYLYEWFEDDKKKPKTVKEFNLESVDLPSTYKNDSMYNGVMCLLTKNGIIDFFDGRRVDNFPGSLDDHHIYPDDYLRNTLGIKDKKKINCVLNRTLIHLSTNRSKYVGNISPKKYLTDIKKNLGQRKFEKLCETHLIDSDLNSKIYEDYKVFINYRKKGVEKLIEESTTIC